MREQKALRAALSTILSISMVMGSVPTAAIAEVLDEDTPLVVEVVEGAANEEASPAEEAPVEEAPVVEEDMPIQETAPVDEHVEPAADPDEHLNLTAEVTPMTVTAAESNTEDDLLGDYVEQLFEEALYGNNGPTITAQMVELTGVDAKVFDLLCPMIAEVANGTRSSSVFEIPLDQITDKLTFTAEELGVESLIVDGQINEAAADAAYATVTPNTDGLIDHLLATHPYELYWFDKTKGLGIEGYGCGVSGSGGQYTLTLTGSLKLTFAVASGYSGGVNVVDASQVARAQRAVATAQQIAAEGASLSPYDCLKLFNDTICSMASYNDEAAAGGVVFGDPWQLVYVFDGEDATKVVCEGYSKAFKYLCDLADIPGVTCYTMSGTMSGGTGAGGHMWNVVKMDDGKNYLVDVTNCDQGTVGYPYQLFIVPFTSGSVTDGYDFNTYSKTISYVYYSDMSQLYTSDELTISATAYDRNQHNANVAAAQAVDELIAKLSPVDELTLGSADAVVSARTAYDALTEAQKGLVENLETLTAAEARVSDLTAAHGVDEQIAALPAIDELTLDNADAVAAARSSFDALTDARKLLVQGVDTLVDAEARIEELRAAAGQHAADLAAAKVVDDEIVGLPKVDDLTLDHADAVAKARTDYDKLTEAQKGLVENLETLTAAEARISDLTAAHAVDVQIAALPAAEDLTLDNADAVLTARTLYDELTSEVQKLVQSLDVLEAAEQRIAELRQQEADKEAASIVDGQIDMLSPVADLTLDNAAAVEAARAAYDKLTEAQKSYVERLETLEAAEKRIADLTEAQAVDAEIAELPVLDELTLANAEAVEVARAAYDALSEAQKALVTNLAVLEAAEARIAELERQAADEAAARAVDEKIAELPALDKLALEDRARVAAARAAYDALTDAQKPLVTQLETLEAAEARIAELEWQAADEAAARAVDEKIAELPALDKLTLEDQARVAAARAAYDALTDAQKPLVTQLETLEAIEDKIKELKQAEDEQAIDEAAARGVDTRIAELSQVDELTLEDADTVADIRSSYNALTDTQKELVEKLDVLEAAEQRIAELRQQAADEAAAQKVEAKIAELPQVEELTLDHATAVKDARTAYDALSDAQKALVENLNALEAAEARIAELKQQAADEAAAQAVDEKIANLPAVDELTPDNADDVNEVRAAYEALTDTQKSLVKNLATLEAAEAKIDEFAKPIGGANIEVATQEYTGEPLEPQVKVTLSGVELTEGTDFTVAAGNCINAGSYTVTITGVGRYEGNAEATFTISPKAISVATVNAISAKTYTGKIFTPAPVVKDGTTKLVKGTDYTVSYKNNTKAGTATVTITGKGNYTGTKTATFKINPKSIAASSVTVSSIAKQKWTGKAIKPTPVVKDGTKTLKSGTDYKLTYKNNKEPGTATITITGMGNYAGARTTTFRIGAKTGTWKKSGSKWWYQYADNTYPKNQFADIDGARYYFDGSGYMVTGWKKVGNYWYYFRSDGKMGANDWAKSGSKWCFLDSVGRMVTGWRTISNVRYYFDANGYMVTGWKTIGGKDYYFKSSGAMAKSEWIGNYYVGADGAWVKGKTK